MDGHIDWLSFTLKCDSEPRTAQQVLYIAKNLVERVSPDVSEIFFAGKAFEPSVGRAPYRYQMGHTDRSFRCFGGGATNTILVEISGRSCDALRDETLSRRIVGQLGSRITRLDYAVDIRTSTRPRKFASERSHNRIRSISDITSKSGETVYVGSPKSDRFVRVYRYAYPHPRHQLLRVEFVFRRKLAKCAAVDYTTAPSLDDFIAKCGGTCGFNHPDWQPGVKTDERISTPERSEHEGKTVSWLYSQVAPAMKRLIDSDALSVVDFLEHVYNL